VQQRSKPGFISRDRLGQLPNTRNRRHNVRLARRRTKAELVAGLLVGVDEPTHFPESLYLICSLADPAQPEVRAWSIVRDAVVEVVIEIRG